MEKQHRQHRQHAHEATKDAMFKLCLQQVSDQPARQIVQRPNSEMS